PETNPTTDGGAEDAGAGALDAADPDAGLLGARVEIGPMILVDFGAFLELTIDGKGPFLLHYDTGSPSTYLDKAHANAAGIQSGTHEVKLGNIVIGSGLVTLIDWIEAGVTYPQLPGPILGLAGNDLFAGNALSVGLDYRDKQIWFIHSQPNSDSAQLPA